MEYEQKYYSKKKDIIYSLDTIISILGLTPVQTRKVYRWGEKAKKLKGIKISYQGFSDKWVYICYNNNRLIGLPTNLFWLLVQDGYIVESEEIVGEENEIN